MIVGMIIRQKLTNNRTKVPIILCFSSLGTEVASGRDLRVPARQQMNRGAGNKAKIKMRSDCSNNTPRGQLKTQRVQTRRQTSTEVLVFLMKSSRGQAMKKYLQHKTDTLHITVQNHKDASFTVQSAHTERQIGTFPEQCTS